MMKFFTRIQLLFLSILFSSNLLFAQDPQFTQFYANPIYLNPAFAGADLCPRVQINARLQWTGISGNYRTYAASYDMHIYKLHGGIGIRAMRDAAGHNTITSHNAAFSYSYHIQISRKISARIAAEVGLWQRSLDRSRLTFGDQIDSRYGFVYATDEILNNASTLFPDFAGGVVLYSDMFYGGVAFHHITEPNEGFLGRSKLPFKFTAHFGAMIPLGRNRKYAGSAFISPNLLFQMQQSFYQLNIGLYAGKGPFVGGIWYRNQDSFIALVGFQKGIFRIGYSYDVTISKLTNKTAGSHELSIGMTFGCDPPRRSFRVARCPSF